MECAACGRMREPNDRGWVVVLSPPTEPPIRYCPDCLSEIVRDASGADEHGEKD